MSDFLRRVLGFSQHDWVLAMWGLEHAPWWQTALLALNIVLVCLGLIVALRQLVKP